MKFSDIEKDQWPELQPYLDTCLLPFTGLTGLEQPWEATAALELLRDALDTIEIPFKGRVVTYPALHYCTGTDIRSQIDEICLQLKKTGFRYVVVLTICQELETAAMENADLFLAVDERMLKEELQSVKTNISKQVQSLWYQEAQ